MYLTNTPQEVRYSEWHLPLISSEDMLDTELLKQVSVGRCARVSYLTHDGKRNLQADIDLCVRLRESGHWSPFEHIATPLATPTYCGNFKGWEQ